jgi:glycosyltransferase involved in cell wall biosynthesis
MGSSLPKRINLKFIDTSSRRRLSSETGSWSVSNLVSAIGDCIRFTKTVILYRPEICHIATAFGLSFVKHSVCVAVARLLGSKALLHPHCSFYALYERQGKTWQWFVRTVIGLCDGVVILSNEWKRLQEVVPSCHTYYLPNAINLLSYLDVGREKIELKSKNACLHILYLGYLGKAKGSFDLISAAKTVLGKEQGVIFDLVGQEHTSGEMNQLNAHIVDERLDQFVHIHPSANGTEKIKFLRSADIFVYPSYHEGMPMAVIEAMACGLPIIATQVGGLPDLVCPGLNGLLVPAGEPEQLANAIHQLVACPQMRYSMQAGSFRLAHENFDIEKLVIRLLDIYQSVLLSRQKTPTYG